MENEKNSESENQEIQALPDNKTILKRSFIVILLVLIFALFYLLLKYSTVLFVYIAAVAVSLVFLILFIRLCIDVHKIARHIEKIDTENKNEY